MRHSVVWLGGAAAIVAAVLPAGEASAQKRKPPYYASISAGEARMRTGPGKNYPVSWTFRRADLPIKVVDIYQDWRKIEDPDGTQGWMQVGLLSDQRTGYVTSGLVELRASPSPSAHIDWRAAPGVVGRLSRCSGGWCYFDVRGRGGYVEQARLWGVDPGEDL